MSPDNGAPFDTNPIADAAHGILESQPPQEKRQERAKTNDAGLPQRAFASANELFPHLKMLGGIAHVTDVNIRAAYGHIPERRIGPL